MWKPPGCEERGEEVPFAGVALVFSWGSAWTLQWQLEHRMGLGWLSVEAPLTLRSEGECCPVLTC